MNILSLRISAPALSNLNHTVSIFVIVHRFITEGIRKATASFLTGDAERCHSHRGFSPVVEFDNIVF
ncbi:MAG: hypothetical protein QOI77_2541 [Blastocatellia bacterium]|nr:hypothetical protein [Blastocatellia bacterium]